MKHVLGGNPIIYRSQTLYKRKTTLHLSQTLSKMKEMGGGEESKAYKEGWGKDRTITIMNTLKAHHIKNLS